MPTQNLVVEGVPKNIVSELNLASGTRYRITNYSGADVQIAELSAAPDTNDFLGHPIPSQENEYFTVASDGIWIWTSGSSNLIVCTEG